MINDQSNFGFEIDFLPVGDSDKSGDAICMRWGNLFGDRKEQFVCVVDGGFAESGDDIVNHIKQYYGTDFINLIINTHPHNDHLGGLFNVIDKCKVNSIIMNMPWSHNLLGYKLKDHKLVGFELQKHLNEKFKTAKSFIEKANEKRVKTNECFAPFHSKDILGVEIFLLGPTQKYYEELFVESESTITLQKVSEERVEFKEKLVPEKYCQLTDEGETSPENNTSLILALKLPNGGIVLLTGDAGLPALSQAVKVAEEKYKLNLKQNLTFFQIPHHGSIQNLGPTILNAILGNIEESKQRNIVTAYASVCKKPKIGHPAKHIINAIIKRNGQCFSTEGTTIKHSVGKVPDRKNWHPSKPISFYTSVEELV